MEPKFQTSFIPKQSLSQVPTPTRKTSHSPVFALGTVIATVIFILAVTASALLFLYEQYLSSSIKSDQQSLAKAREAFEPALIQELTRLDQRIEAANQILDQHIAPSGLFNLLQTITLQNVQFTSFSYDNGTASAGLVHISLTGRAKSFKSVALQSDVVGTNQYLRNAAITNLGLDQSGNVSFDLTADVDARLVSYQSIMDTINTQNPETTGSAVPPAATTSTVTNNNSISI
jgi:hypothetical protein